MSKDKCFIYSTYAIFLMAYLTLTSTAPILMIISAQSHISLNDLQLSVSILFLLFSCSSIILGSVSDFLGRRNVLLAAQSTGVIGLIVCIFSDSFLGISVGLAIVGLGTGAYSVVARSIVNHTIKDPGVLFKVYSSFSLLIMLGAIVSNKLSITIAGFLGWSAVYMVLFSLEIIILLTTYFNIHEPDKKFKPSRVSISYISQQFIYCLKQTVFIKNAILVGLFLSVILGLFLALGPEVFIDHFHVTLEQYGNIALMLCLIYMVGNFTAKYLVNHISKRRLKFVAFIFVLVGTTVLTFSSTLSCILVSFIIISLASGILVPMGTHGGMTVIKKFFGTAAATYTALFSIFSALWSCLYAIINVSPLTLIIGVLWVIIIFCSIFEYFLPDQ